jgi:hypothetical protein
MAIHEYLAADFQQVGALAGLQGSDDDEAVSARRLLGIEVEVLMGDAFGLHR